MRGGCVAIDAILARIAAHPIEGTPEEMRAAFERLMGETPQGKEVEVGGGPALALGTGPTVMFLHGGGYIFGSPRSHMRAVARLAANGLRVVAPSYRLAPEHVWPAQLEDALAAYDALRPDGVLGISSGGHLALRLAMERGVGRLALLSPNTDRSGRSRTRERNTPRDATVADEDDCKLAEMALGHLADDDPVKSPLLADLSALPPLHLSVASNEVLLDDTLLLARRAGIAGVETALHVAPGLFHMFHLWPDEIPVGGAALDRVAAFLRG